MSGHSKFSNIKHKKEKTDAARGKIFTKLGRELMVAIKEGGADPEANSKLKDVIAKCKSNNMPNDTIQRSIKKYSGEGANVDYETVTYEGYGPNGIAIMVECLTDNKNRSASDVRHAFTRNGGNMGSEGCVSFMFDKKGQILVDVPEGMSEDDLMMTVLDAGADDFSVEDGTAEILTSPENFSAVYDKLEKAGLNITSGEITQIPQNYVTTDDEGVLSTMDRLVDALEDCDDVQNVYTNLE